MAETEKKGSTFSRIMKSVGKAVLLTAGALISPIGFTFKKGDNGKRRFRFDFNRVRMAIFTGVYFVAQPLSIFLFPTMRTTLKNEGFDPDVSKNITTTSLDDIRVIPNNAAGKAYILFSTPPILQPLSLYDNIKTFFSSGLRGMTGGIDVGIVPRLISPRMKTVFLKDNETFMERDNTDMAKTIEASTNGMFTYAPPLTGPEYDQVVILHELRHTDPKNMNLSSLFREADADYTAITTLAALNGDATLVPRMIDLKALNPADADHDDALYLYLTFNRVANMPTEADMRQANIDATPAMDDYMQIYVNTIVGATDDSLVKAFKEKAGKLSELATLRLELLEQALGRHIVVNVAGIKGMLKPDA